MKIYDIEQITGAIDLNKDLRDLIASQKQAYIDFSNKKINVPLPIQMHFPKSQGDCHIKAGYKENDDIFIVKIATGFYQNTQKRLPAGSGAVLAFSQQTGLLQAIFCEGGFLTTLRTALASALAASITPWEINHIGIIGTGQLAIQILAIMKILYPNVTIHLWGRSYEKASQLAANYEEVKVCESIKDLMSNAGLIITTTASTEAIIDVSDVVGNTHIVALGADDVHKQECDPRLFQIADLVLVDSRQQSLRCGDTFHAMQAQMILDQNINEFGELLQNDSLPYAKFIITDLTGIAAQDIAIARFVIQKLEQNVD